MNYFELFGFPVSPRVDKTLVSQKYFALQKINHPDFFTQATEAEKEDALQQSAAINKAFTIFQNDEKTIEYFLQEKGVIQTDEKYQLPPDFLMEMMELNETLNEKDGVTLAEEMADIERPLLEEIKPILEKSSKDIDATELEKLKAYYYKKKYLKRILDRLGD
ncbi:MAG TPA: iron-sulfur cluster co-chaperone HscB C-terminal domain-containing protein [Ferruginibacter sp.]|nr:iron-sulfur cluster co-chaperone HscB C-terminal domain-containing protein [Ferruginibacter sp.]